MPKIYGDLQRAQFETLSSNPAAATLGRFWWNSTDGKAYFDKSTANRPFLLNDDKAIIGNSGTASDNIRFHRGAAGVLQLVSGADTTTEGTLSTAINQLAARHENYTNAGLPAAGNAGRQAWVTDQSVLKVDTGTTWLPVGSGGGGGALRWVESANAPQAVIENNVQTYQYPPGDSQELYTTVKVPESYVGGLQIKLKLPFYSPSTSNTALLSAQTTLIQKNSDAITDVTDQYTSTNTARTLAAPANKVFLETLDLTSSTGTINSVAVAAGDLLVVRLYRGTDTDTADLRALVYGAEVTFNG